MWLGFAGRSVSGTVAGRVCSEWGGRMGRTFWYSVRCLFSNQILHLNNDEDFVFTF